MKLLSIHCCHDGNVTTYDSDSGQFTYTKSERFTNIKHGNGIPDLEHRLNEFNPDYIYVIVAPPNTSVNYNFKLYGKYADLYSGVPENGQSVLQHYTGVEERCMDVIRKVGFDLDNVYWVQHHYAHILSSWPMSRPDYGVAIDAGCEDYTTKLIVKNPFDIVNAEVLLRKDENAIANNPEQIPPNNLGLLLDHIAENQLEIMGQNLDSAGKVMGLQAYGNVDYSIFGVNDSSQLLTNFPTNIYEASSRIGSILNTDGTFKQEGLNFVTTVHKLWSDFIVDMFVNHIPSDSSVVYSGGCAQNTLVNYDLLKIYDKLEVVPHCYDGGLAVGGIGFGMMQHNLPFPDVPNFPYIQSDESTDIPSDETIKKVAKMLADGKIVGWYQGNGEIGPRALGNRSILMNAGAPNGKNVLNDRIKHREWWRPFAPSVLESEAHKWFEVPEGFVSKYMLYAVSAKTSMSPIIPSVVHDDLSSRIQTVSESDNLIYHKLISEFHDVTGIPILLNTSLNDGGYPIMGTRQQAINMVHNTDLDAVCIGDKIYT